MHYPPFLAAVSDFPGYPVLPVLPHAGLVYLVTNTLILSIPIVAIIAVYYSKNRREKLWHETARLAIEKGQPIPQRPPSKEELKYQLPPAGTNLAEWDRLNRANRRRNDLRRGLITLGLGLGLYFGWHWPTASFVLIGVGAAMILNGLIDGLFSHKSSDSGDLPPQS